MRLVAAAAILMLAGCGSTETSAGVAPCSGLFFIVISGSADLTLDCPATGALKLIERKTGGS